MKRLRIYVDTSVIGGCFDPEFHIWSNGLIEDFRAGRFGLVLSDVTATEIERAPVQLQEFYTELTPFAEILLVTEEALVLLEKYEARGVLDTRFRNDMLHIALATVAGVDVLVSWNFQHIVRLDKIQQFNGINLELGYKPLAIYSPREVTTYEREE
jgi:predicted nucleic acid-binding protein